ncbi:Murein hydrolase activator EnvC precursor [Methyloligella halotolerans]|uniref:Murein hydrolase activator EnvC n=1 Tax=Methyloligella halotolerans TaxID=1177755 RepID=A0A1E2S1D5_9HYPH|nr:peptidoglycan DD-metalloendopeptidase family protein [Methyloligella halotolerans]ODA68139.1 Murein hydrolase activator EnvC precursor [Methyloligella halotolerans]
MAGSLSFGSRFPHRLALIVALALPLLPSAAPAQDGASGETPPSIDEELTRDEAKQKLESTRQELEQSRSRQEGLAEDVVALAKERAKLNEALIEAGRRVQASEAKLSQTEAKLKEMSDQVETVQSSITDRKRTIVKMLSAMQRIGRSPPPALVTPREDSLAAVRSAMLLAKVFPELKYQADLLSDELDRLVALEDGIRQERDREQQDTEKLAAERNRLDQLLEAKKQRLQASQSELVAVKEQAEEQAQQVGSLGELVEKLDDRIAKAEIAQYEAEVAAEQALRKRQEEQMLGGPDDNLVEVKPESRKVAFASPDRMKPAVPFDDTKGELPLPAQGQYLAKFGDEDELGGTRKGLSLATRPKARVTAPADGWVVYSGPFRSYGQLLILNAGGGYHILLAGMNRIDVTVGQFVLAGEPIAEMGVASGSNGKDGATSRPALYVEFRKDGRPIDPDPWWAELSDKVQG